MNDDLNRLRSALADRYSIEREIGAGGMATVYLAQDLKHERRVALKVLRADLAATLGPERFLQEVRVTANLQHPHILPLFDSGDAEGFLFFVMPYIEGESLRERLTRERELPVSEAARLLRDVVDALAAAHRMGVVHRDIKPENVLISGRHAMVADFGVAKAVSEATGRHKLTTMGVALGTPFYMAPEQAAADEKIDHRADIYAVGAMAYELLTGRPPFHGRTAQEILAAQVMEPPQPVTSLRPSVPPALDTLIMRCLEKKPADRWQSAEEMLPHLEALATPSGGMTPTDLQPVTTKAARPGRRPSAKVLWASGAVMAAVLALVAGWAIANGSGTGSGAAGQAGGGDARQAGGGDARQAGGGDARQAGGSGSAAAAAVPTLDSTLLVVLPFENRTGDPENDLLGSLAAEWTTRTLDQTGSVEVVPSTAIRDLLRGMEDPSAVSALELARRMRARYAMAGSFASLGGSLRFESELLDVRSGELLRSLDPVIGPSDSLDVAVGRVARTFAANALALLAPGMNRSFEGASLPPNLEAYEAAAAGLDAFCSRQYDAAAEQFRRSISLAPSWPLPALALVPTLGNAGRAEEATAAAEALEPLLPTLSSTERLMWDQMSAPTAWEQFRATEELYRRNPGNHGYGLAFRGIRINRLAAAKEGVLAIDFEDPCNRTWRSNWVLAAQVLHLLGEEDAALERARDGRSRFPQDALLVLSEARPLAALGDVAGVRSLADTLKTLPVGATTVVSDVMEMALELRAHGHRGAADALLEDMLAWADEDRVVDDFQRGRVLYYLERYEEALPLFEAVAATGSAGQYPAYQALTLDALGRAAEADSVMAAVEERYGVSRYPALLAARRGDAQRAVDLLRAAFQDGLVYYAFNQVNLHRDPDLEPIRDDPVFQTLMRPVG